MGAGVDVRVHAQGNRRALAEAGGHFLQALQFLGGFDVEAVHADFQGATHVLAALADTGEDDLARLAAGGQHALQFTARDDVEAGAQARQQVQHAEVGVGLHGEAHQVRQTGQRIGVGAVLGLDVGAGIDVGGGAETFGNGGQGHAFREQYVVAVAEGLHAASWADRARVPGAGL